MLRITTNKSASAATKYFDEGLAKSDYYAQKNEIIGKWGGKTARMFNLDGEVTKKEFELLANNINPDTNEQLTARNSASRRVGYDFTFSVPKSVSIIYSQTKDKDILDAFDNAVSQTMLEIEKNASTRVRSAGKNENRFTENLVWGSFTHDDARPVGGIPDPHLHQHVFVFNATYDEQEKRFKAAQFGDIKADAQYYEACFNARLAKELQKAGYQVERDKHNFQVKGFERETIEKFSNRTREINTKAEELGIDNDKQREKLGAITRENKRTGYDKEDIRLQWRSRLSTKEIELIENAKNEPPPEGGGGNFVLSRGRTRTVELGGNLLVGSSAVEKKKLDAEGAIDYALSHSLERKSVVSEKELMVLGLKRGMGAVTPEELKKELSSREDLLSQSDKTKRETYYTTYEAIEEESKLRDVARQGRNQLEPVNPDYKVKNELLTEEQSNAVNHVLRSKDFITVVAGDAGTGKTWSIKEVAEGIQEKGVNFGAFAPSSAASRQVQRDDGFENATTIAELLQSKKLQESIKDGWIWLDEGGQVGNKTMNKVIDVAKQQNARILITGDIKQHGSVERGDALRILEQYGGIKPAVISKIQRQKNTDYREAVQSIAKGHMNQGFKALDKMGAIKESDSFDETKSKVAEEYAHSVKSKENVLIVATTHAQGKAVTDTVREKLKSEGIVSKAEKSFQVQKNLSFTDAEKTDANNYSEGMTVQFHQNIKGGIQRGQKYEVRGKDREGNVRIALKGKEESLKLPMHEASKFSVYQSEGLKLAKGDKIRITQNGFSNEKKRLNNGNILSVKGFDKKGNIIASTGKNEVVVDRSFGNFTHGYYTTSPASQGKSVNRVIVLQSSLTGKAGSKEQFYVSASRGKFAISIHTDDKEGLLNSIQRSSARITAMDMAKNSGQERIDKLKKIGAIQRVAISQVANQNEKGHDKLRGQILSVTPKPIKQVKNAPVRTK